MTADHVRAPHLVFTGRAANIFSADFLKSLCWALAIIGLPIAILIWCWWLNRHIVMPDGTTFIFSGTLNTSSRWVVTLNPIM